LGRALSALDDVVNVEDVRRIGELNADTGEDRHQALPERLELLPRVPDLADAKVAVRTETDVVVEPGRCTTGPRSVRTAGEMKRCRLQRRRMRSSCTRD
jgi:hypothetical protein